MRDVDRVVVVSDLHFGGDKRQIFAAKHELPWLLDELAKDAAKRQVAFVINGDFIDFLAEPNARYFDFTDAPKKLARIASDPSFAASFEALGRFAEQRYAELIINLGNHDLELALPDVQTEFARQIGSHRITWVIDGTGVGLNVGGCRVLCLHGNEADITNVVDFQQLLGFRRAQITGKPGLYKGHSWIPNAGTQLVIDAMNAIKEDHAFIDILKPETEAAVRVLLALDFEKAKQLAAPAFRAMAIKRSKDQVKRWFGVLGVDGDAIEGEILAHQDGADWLEVIDQRFRKDPSIADSRAGMGQLGVSEDISLLWRKLRGRDATEALREALEVLAKDRSFEIGEAEPMNTDLLDQVDIDVHFLCSGHTHFARSLRRGPNAHHFNSGTWAYLMRLDKARSDPAAFVAMVETLKKKPSMDQLAQAGFAFKKLTCIDIEAVADDRARGSLCEVVSELGHFALAPVGGTEVILERGHA